MKIKATIIFSGFRYKDVPLFSNHVWRNEEGVFGEEYDLNGGVPGLTAYFS